MSNFRDRNELMREVLSRGIDVVEGSRVEKGKGERARAYFEAWVTLLKSGDGPITRDLQAQIAGLFEYLSRGIIPEPILDCSRGMRGSLVAPTEERDIRRAVIYVLAARKGLVSDRSPVKTVMDAFESKTRQNVQGWIRKYQPSVTPAELSEAGEIITRQMIEAGRRYAVDGRRQTPINLA